MRHQFCAMKLKFRNTESTLKVTTAKSNHFYAALQHTFLTSMSDQ